MRQLSPSYPVRAACLGVFPCHEEYKIVGGAESTTRTHWPHGDGLLTASGLDSEGGV